ERANALLHTGYSPNPRLQYPALGASIAKYFDDPEADVPAYVSIGSSPSAGIFGPKFGAVVVSDGNNPAPALTVPAGVWERRRGGRLVALEQFNAQFGQQFRTPLSQDLTALTRRADRMRRSPIFRPYDVAAEEPETYERYGGGANDFVTRAVIAARRLVEAGV